VHHPSNFRDPARKQYSPFAPSRGLREQDCAILHIYEHRHLFSSIRPQAKARLQKLAKSTGRSRSFLAAEAIVAYLDTNEWQVAGITKALSSLDRGRGVAHEHVRDWVASWETRKERPAPKRV